MRVSMARYFNAYFQLRMTKSEKRLFEQTAKSQHEKVSVWIRRVLLQAAKNERNGHQTKP